MDETIAQAMNILWRGPASPTRGPKPKLTHGMIARAGIALADTEGLSAVSMQRISESLGVTKMALYRYVPSKIVLLALMTDEAMHMPHGIDLDPNDWRASLTRWAHGLADLLMQHGWVLEVTQGPRPVGPTETLWLDRALACLEHARLDGQARISTVAAIAGMVRGVVQQQLAAPSGGEESSHFIEAIRDAARRGRKYPALAAAISERSGVRRQALDHGLDLIFDGLERHMG
ncbi:TetR/AcrR family transcriptional regulator [Pelagibacterium lentulum]|uniref:TetR family transcriptional regulator n=1 Tax=Pelagibacterium lentulum TaxID=2029865 RepID=A0A916W140_9HYPH|nr:TetR/AcrR family transcriptional regulator [Pelagibacterium lentulum]GGA59172.1 TetR family transcriptional regulator [Pelagibacterium lentulum]